jgi:GNAT superfamily N-acetyltransferase
MSAPALSVRRATAADRRRSADVLAGAFSDDPVFLRMLPADVSRREDRLRRFFALELPRSVAEGGAWTTADGAGAAVWYPPGRWKPSLWRTVLQTPAMLRVLGKQASSAGQMLAAMQQHHPAAPHWYLMYLAAETGRTGSGIGTALLQPVLYRCDTDGLPAYLEATTQRNRALYRRHGFTDLPELVLPDGGPVLYPMWREPRRPTQA